MHACMCVCIYVCMCVCVNECMYVCMHACMHACVYVCTYARICVCMCLFFLPKIQIVWSWVSAGQGANAHLEAYKSYDIMIVQGATHIWKNMQEHFQSDTNSLEVLLHVCLSVVHLAAWAVICYYPVLWFLFQFVPGILFCYHCFQVCIGFLAFQVCIGFLGYVLILCFVFQVCICFLGCCIVVDVPVFNHSHHFSSRSSSSLLMQLGLSAGRAKVFVHQHRHPCISCFVAMGNVTMSISADSMPSMTVGFGIVVATVLAMCVCGALVQQREEEEDTWRWSHPDYGYNYYRGHNYDNNHYHSRMDWSITEEDYHHQSPLVVHSGEEDRLGPEGARWRPSSL